MSAQTTKKAAAQPRRRSRAKPRDEIKRRGWSTREQDDFLQDYLPKYKTAQSSRKFDAFWMDVSNAFSSKWPSEDTPDGKRQRKNVSSTGATAKLVNVNIPHTQNLRSWFNNKTRAGGSKIIPDLLKFKTPKKNKLRHDFQAYSKLYYEERIKAASEQAWEDALAAFANGEITEKPNNLTIRQDVTKTLFESESKAVKERVKEYRLEWNKAIDDGKEPRVEEDKDADKEDGEDVEDPEEAAEKRRIEMAEQYLM